MVNNSKSKSARPDPVEREFAETLRQAAYIFEREENGRFQGSILACRAVARFIHLRNGGAELAGPFLQIAEAFKELERGGKPRLFSKKTVPEKERERSPERKHVQMLAAAALEVSLKLRPRGSNMWSDDGSGKNGAANRVARHVNKWPGMRAQQVKGGTVIAWRNRQRRLSDGDRKPFDAVVKEILEQPKPQQTLEGLLRNGPPGVWKS
jgi:hypothetical protein